MITSRKQAVDVGRIKRGLRHLKEDQTRVLAGFPINTLYILTQIEETHEQKIAVCVVKLESSTLGPQDIVFGYQRHWWPSLTFAASIISFKN